MLFAIKHVSCVTILRVRQVLPHQVRIVCVFFAGAGSAAKRCGRIEFFNIHSPWQVNLVEIPFQKQCCLTPVVTYIIRFAYPVYRVSFRYGDVNGRAYPFAALLSVLVLGFGLLAAFPSQAWALGVGLVICRYSIATVICFEICLPG